MSADITVDRSLARFARATFLLGMMLLGFSTSPAEGSFVVAFGLVPLTLTAAVYVAMRLRQPMVEWIVIPYASAGVALAAGLALSTIVAPVPFQSVARLVPNLLGFVIFAYVMSPFYQPGRPESPPHRELSAVVVLSGIVIGMYFIVRFVLAVAQLGFAAVIVDRVTGGVYSLPWGATNVVASALILPIFLSFYVARVTAGTGARFVILCGRAVMLAAAAVALSRGVNTCLAVGMFLLLFVLRGQARRQLLGFLVLVAVGLIVADRLSGGAISDQLFGAFLERFQSADTGSLNGRADIWSQFLSGFLQSPFLGVGYFGSLRTFETSGHNFVLTSLVERGVIGFALSSFMLTAAIRYWYLGFRAASSAELRLFFATLGVGGFTALLHLMFEDANFTQPYMILSWVALALPFLGWRRTLTPVAHAFPPPHARSVPSQ